MNETAELKQRPASGFYNLLAQTPLTIWVYCGTCWDRTEQEFHHEDERFEYYVCRGCGKLHGVAVR